MNEAMPANKDKRLHEFPEPKSRQVDKPALMGNKKVSSNSVEVGVTNWAKTRREYAPWPKGPSSKTGAAAKGGLASENASDSGERIESEAKGTKDGKDTDAKDQKPNDN